MNIWIAKLKNIYVKLRLQGKKIDPLLRTNLGALEGLILSSPVRCSNYVVFDLETTGLNLKDDQIVSIGAFRIVNGHIQLGNVFNRIVNPRRSIPVESIKIHGIVPDMMSKCANMTDVLREFLLFIKTDILIAHHARFDIHFINALMQKNYGFKIQNIVLDTVLMCRNIAFPSHPYPYGFNMEYISLDEIARHYRIEIQERHTAIGDALSTAMIFQRMIAKMEKDGKDRLSRLVKIAGV